MLVDEGLPLSRDLKTIPCRDTERPGGRSAMPEVSTGSASPSLFSGMINVEAFQRLEKGYGSAGGWKPKSVLIHLLEKGGVIKRMELLLFIKNWGFAGSRIAKSRAGVLNEVVVWALRLRWRFLDAFCRSGFGATIGCTTGPGG